MGHPSAISDADIVRSRADPRFKQVLLAKSLEKLLGTLHRLQHSELDADPARTRQLREGAVMAVKLADLIRAIDDKLQIAAERQ